MQEELRTSSGGGSAEEGRIRIMPESLSNKIAAGEVVQRPASVAKELLENAIDSGAGSIALILKQAGSALVQVVDDGCGMSREDARICFRRHATSKLFSVEGLNDIRTLGFRGEALSSITAVSQMELRTRRAEDETGLLIRNEGGRTVAEEPCAMQGGTSVAVRNLFYNVPARRNFLKTAATELRHVVDVFRAIVLSHPGIAFTMIHEEMDLHKLPAEAGEPMEALRGRIGALLGQEYVGMLVPVEEQTSYLTVQGFVGEPELHRKGRGEQFLFVNGRAVRNRSLEHAIHSTYEQLLPKGTYPFFCVFLSLDPSRYDVNVHPSKAEIRFDDDRGVYHFLKSVVSRGIGSIMLSPRIGAGAGEWRVGEPVRDFTVPEGRGLSPRREARPAGDVGRHSMELYRGVSGDEDGGPRTGGTRLVDEEFPSPVRSEQPGDDTLLWQLHGRYILTEIRSGLMILDQHAAHERVLYERTLDHIRQGRGISQQLLFAETIDFSPSDREMLDELLPDLRSLGFDVETTGRGSVIVRGVPADIRSGDEKGVLEDVLACYRDGQERFDWTRHENLAAGVAHRGAIRPGTVLSPAEMRLLIDQLFACDKPFVCPQGRPTAVRISNEELAKRFRN